MALTDTKLRNLKPKQKPHSFSDGGGLFIEVMPSGKRIWRLRYRLKGRQEKVTLGEYPYFSLGDARKWREECRALVAKGESPMRANREAKAAEKEPDTIEAFSKIWLRDVVEKTTSEPRNVKRVVNKDIIPALGNKRLSEVSVTDVLAITDKIKARGADQSALLTRNVLKRLFAYAIARQKATYNPAAAVEARFIAQAKSRDVSLSSDEVGKLLRAIYTSNMRRSHKLGLHLLILCMVRKSELTEAKWEEIDFDKAEWCIPADRMKKEKPHIVYLSRQALAMFDELKALSSTSPYIMPSRGSLQRPISKSTLNTAIRALDLEIRDFVIHDFRRTASTHLHEAGFNTDWIEKALAHEQKGVRGIYNRAEYSEQRREMMQWWTDFVDAQIEEGRKVIIGQFGKEYRAS
ncbi:phage integrase [Thiohalobacter thiocyanaticus]|uniref:Phage integrase n=1 Tax=Thiohalobacter thiocyanaticus TaxID=585455 RepID=A0A1Z4VLW7_9GAMM|nr:tyrosine-type recombinase/integrase [Thiohalobacter thiocyanaticus]BAZ92606.1 phage integrase [Thiohalobacter thiocyanaticus]